MYSFDQNKGDFLLFWVQVTVFSSLLDPVKNLWKKDLRNFEYRPLEQLSESSLHFAGQIYN